MSLLRTLPSGVRWSGSLIVSALALGVVAYLGVEQCALLLSATLAPEAAPAGQNLDRAIASHDELMEVSRRRFAGRSIFTAPSAPIRVAPPPPPPRDPPPPPPPPAPIIPAEYTGQKPLGLLGNMVLFGDGVMLAPGQQNAGVTVLEIKAPYSVRLGHAGGEYDVPIFTRADLSKLAEQVPPRAFPGISPATGIPAPGRGEATPEGRIEAGDGPQPGSITKEQVDQMDRRQAQQALTAVARAKAAHPDEATKQKLDEETGWLVERIKAAK